MDDVEHATVHAVTNQPSEALDEKWLGWFYARVTDQFTLSRQSLHSTHQWVITLTLGLVTAVLTLGSQQSQYPNELGFVALLASLPLLFRFFVRSCLECSIQYKWMAIRDALDRFYYLTGADPEVRHRAENYLRETIELHYFNWRSPLSLWTIAWENLRLAYLWPFVLLASLIVWGGLALCMSPLIGVVAIVVIVYMAYEFISFVTYRGFKRAKPSTRLPDLLASEQAKMPSEEAQMSDR
jgi:hypothetical protein